MIWNLLKKDVRLLWPFALTVTVAQAMNGTLHFVRDHVVTSASFRNITILFPIVVLLAMASLAVTVVHQDPLTSTADDWLVRPVRRRDLLLAKVLFVILLIHLPILVLDASEGLLAGAPLGEALFAALTRSATLFGAITAPALMLGAVTASLAEAVLLGGVVVIALVALVLILGPYAQQSSPRSPMGLGWIPTAASHVGMFLISAAVVAFQYLRRQTRTARTLGVIAVLALVPITYLPIRPSFAVQQWVAPASAEPIRVDLAPGATPSPEPARDGGSHPLANDTNTARLRSTLGSLARRSATQLQLPVRIGDLPSDGIVFADSVLVRLLGSDGQVRYEGVGNCLKNPYATGTTCFPSELAGSPATRTYAIPLQVIMIPTPVYEKLKAESLRVEVDYFLTQFAGRAEVSLDTHTRLHPTAGMGLCRTRIDDDGDAVSLTCLSAHTPPSCITLALEDPDTGVRNPPAHQCGFDYSPYVRDAFEDPLVRFNIELPFTDTSHTIRFPIAVDRIPEARLFIKTYTPVAHFQRKIVIPAARLSDWEMPPMRGGTRSAGGPYRIVN